jgi:hypothetical protein
MRGRWRAHQATHATHQWWARRNSAFAHFTTRRATWACQIGGPAALLSFNGGFVDTAGFLGLQGLFVAHVTGNFVTLGAALV